MSPVQRSDDPGRSLREVWLGPQGAWRWPFDATMGEWVVAIAATIVAFFVFWLVLPLGGFLILAAWAWARWANRSIRAHRNWTWAYFAAIVLAFVAIFPSPGTWALPMSWWLAPLSAITLAVMVVRRARPYLDSNRPFRYWLKTWQHVARGPRPRRTPAVVAPASLTLDNVLDEAEPPPMDDMAKFMLAVHNTEPEEIFVGHYRRTIVQEVDVMLWAPKQGRAETSTSVVAWLKQHGVPYSIGKVTYKQTGHDAAGNPTEVLSDAELFIDGIEGAIPNDRVIVLDLQASTIEIRTRRSLAEEFEPVKELAR